MIELSRRDRVFYTVNYTLATLFFLVVLYPLIYVVSASFSNPDAVIAGRVWLLPVDVTLEGYLGVFRHSSVWTGYANSFFYMTVGTVMSVTATVFAAYPLSRREFPFRSGFMFILAFTLFFNGGLIPTFLLVRDLKLLNTRAAMILPSLIGVWNVIVARTFFQTTIPGELLDAAKIDGADDFQFFFRIVVPLSGAIIAVLGLFYAVGYWNTFFNALLYLNDSKLFPLQLILRNILIQNEFDPSLNTLEEMVRVQALKNLLKYSLIVVASLPVLVVYPFVQRFFIKGILIGGIKG